MGKEMMMMVWAEKSRTEINSEVQRRWKVKGLKHERRLDVKRSTRQ